MSTTPEGKVKKEVKAMLTAYGAFHHWPVLTGYGEPMLDCNGCHRGRYFAIETKAPGKQLSPRQELIVEKIEAAGGKVFVIGDESIMANDLRGKPVEVYKGMSELEAWLLKLLP